MRRYYKRLITAAGIIVTLAATGAFAKALASAVAAIDANRLADAVLPAFLAPLGLYLVAYAAMTSSWLFLAGRAGMNAPPLVLIRIYLISQIAKYLPGNIGHFVGRVYMANRHGIPPERTGAAIGLELTATFLSCVMLIATLALFGAALGIRYDAGVVGRLLPGWGAALLLLAAVFLCAACAVLFRKNRRAILDSLPAFGLGALMIALTFLITGGCSLLILGALTAGVDIRSAVLILSAFIASWLAGFVTPGSPAGVGVREFAFLSLLQGEFATESLSLTIGAFRLVTVIGDLIAWCVGFAVGSPGTSPRRQSGEVS